LQAQYELTEAVERNQVRLHELPEAVGLPKFL
jgi:hypothetical protein